MASKLYHLVSLIAGFLVINNNINFVLASSEDGKISNSLNLRGGGIVDVDVDATNSWIDHEQTRTLSAAAATTTTCSDETLQDVEIDDGSSILVGANETCTLNNVTISAGGHVILENGSSLVVAGSTSIGGNIYVEDHDENVESLGYIELHDDSVVEGGIYVTNSIFDYIQIGSDVTLTGGLYIEDSTFANEIDGSAGLTKPIGNLYFNNVVVMGQLDVYPYNDMGDVLMKEITVEGSFQMIGGQTTETYLDYIKSGSVTITDCTFESHVNNVYIATAGDVSVSNIHLTHESANLGLVFGGGTNTDVSIDNISFDNGGYSLLFTEGDVGTLTMTDIVATSAQVGVWDINATKSIMLNNIQSYGVSVISDLNVEDGTLKIKDWTHNNTDQASGKFYIRDNQVQNLFMDNFVAIGSTDNDISIHGNVIENKFKMKDSTIDGNLYVTENEVTGGGAKSSIEMILEGNTIHGDMNFYENIVLASPGGSIALVNNEFSITGGTYTMYNNTADKFIISMS